MLTTLLRTVSSLFCHHEWMTRREPGRVYLECVNCLATTAGIEITPQRLTVSAGRVVATKRPLVAVKAA
jgi:hypothetical protein